MKRFTTNGACVPELNYMVKTDELVSNIIQLIDDKQYFAINRARQYGRRMDVEIHYLGKRYIIELKIWHGERYHRKGEQQIIDYLDYFGLQTGYMLSFNFNKKKKMGVERIRIGDKVLYEGTL